MATFYQILTEGFNTQLLHQLVASGVEQPFANVDIALEDLPRRLLQ